MSDIPFGFGPSNRGDDGDDGENTGGSTPSGGTPPGGTPPGFGLPAGASGGFGGMSGAFGGMSGAFGGMSGAFGGMSGAFGGMPEDLMGKVPLFAELQKLFSWSGGPVNWDLAQQIAISQLAGGHAPVEEAQKQAIVAAVRLADLWLDDVTTLPSGVTSVTAWNRVEWVERTVPVWSTLCDPVAARVVESMSTGLPEEVRAQAGPMDAVMAQLGGMMFGAQVGQALAGLAGEVLSSTDVGVPLGPAGTAALLPQNVTAFGAGLSRPAEEVRLYLALREAAHHRLFGHVPWLRQRLVAAVDAYARGISVDTSALERAVAEIDPTNPESLQNALSGGMFQPQETEAQQAALRRLETLLALVEGWVDAVVAEAAGARLAGADALRETLRRRRAAGGPAEQTFATLVGLELRPRRLRDAATLWDVALRELGPAGRDGLWSHPDLLPVSEDLDDPAAFVARHHTGDASDPISELDAASRSESAGAPDAAPAVEDDSADNEALGPDDEGPEQPGGASAG